MNDPLATRPDGSQNGGEKAEIGSEPLLPVEKKLVAISLLLGAALLGVLLWLSSRFFPVS
jgi:hypothetical protein